MRVSPDCISVNQVHAMSKLGQKRTSDSLGMELQIIAGCLAGVENWTWFFRRAASAPLSITPRSIFFNP